MRTDRGPPAASDEGSFPNPNDQQIQIMAGLIKDCQATGAALHRGDLTHALGRTRTIRHVACLAGFTDIEWLAAGLDHAILAAAEGRPTGLGIAFDHLSRAIDDRLEHG